ncbi:MAG: hypothetical protein JST40_07590 [Armatimonadetes bacterium]|nr:hypothetical protein [Armatimonadota bacterium]
MTMMLKAIRIALFVLISSLCTLAGAQSFVAHDPATGVYNASGTQRDPYSPREDEIVTLYFSVGYQFTYDAVAVYYTTDGSTPSGTRGVPSGTSQVLKSSSGQIQFHANQSTGNGVVDWWKTTLPSNTRSFGQTVRYAMQAWTNSTLANTTVYSFTNKIAWPGQGSAFSNPNVGYPPYHMWKEEAVTGNNYINVMLDQNGTFYDVYYPSAGTVQGVAAKNEGYVDGLDTFPPGLPQGSRGQLNLNCAFGGIRVGGITYWLTNSNGGDYQNLQQRYVDNSQTVYTSQKFSVGGRNIDIQQYDFAPKGISYPTDLGGTARQGFSVKRILLTNNGGSTQTLDYYFYMDPALNGGDNFDAMSVDSTRGAMIAYDNTGRTANSAGEYNPSSFSNYDKQVSIYLAASAKVLDSVGGTSGTYATDFWRDTSADNGEGWLGTRVTIPAGQTKEIDLILVGGFDAFPNATGTYNYQMAPVLDWFKNNNMASMMTATDSYWSNWLTSGVTIDTPDNDLDKLFNRSELGTALHLDGKTGAVVAGMHNGAYMYCWPRDAVWAAVTLTRTGHFTEASEVYRFLREVAYRAPGEAWGKGFFYQKYTTDGYIIWGSPQVDETAVMPWGVKYLYDAVGNNAILTQNWTMVRDSAFSMSSDSALDSRLYYDDGTNLMYSMSLWEDAFDEFIFSNANVVRGLWDAASIAHLLGNFSDRDTFNGRAGNILNGVKGRLDWNGENTDISQLGVSYPFNVLAPNDARMAKVVDRMNGVATDRYGNTHPIMNFSGEWQNLVNRYWGDTYWNGGPWTLSTLWYGCYYGQRANYTPGAADIDNLKLRIDRVRDFMGPLGLGSEQISPSNSLLYPGQSDFRLQAAWPNAWESMSFLADAIMMYLDFTPDAPANTLRVAPKLPTGWPTMTFKNLKYGPNSVDVTATQGTAGPGLVIKNNSGFASNFSAWLKLPVGYVAAKAYVNNRIVATTYDKVAHRIKVEGAMASGAGATTTIRLVLASQNTESGTVRPNSGGRP